MKKKVIFKTRDGNCDAYLSAPDHQQNLPIVLLYMDAVGLRQRLFDMADHLAEQGYFVLTPNLFYRTKPAPIVDYDNLLKPENIPEMFRQIREIATQITTEMSARDVADFLQFARTQAGVNPKKVGAVGYCMGGGQVLRAAGNYPDDIQAAASFHAGNLATDAESSPHRWFPQIKAEVYIGHADHDQHMPPEQMLKVKEALEAAGVRFKAELYQDCHHGWTMRDLPAYNEAGERRHWSAVFDLFSRTLKT